MTRKTRSKTASELKALVAEDEDFLRPIVQLAGREFFEAEMNGAARSAVGRRERPRASAAPTGRAIAAAICAPPQRL